MAFKVVAFDLDGTLLNSQGQILASSKQAIAQVRTKGVKVVLVTGRHHTAVKPYYHELQLDTPIVCCNGTYIYHPEDDRVELANPLTQAHCDKVIEMAQRYNLHLLMYSRDAMNFQQLNPHMEKFIQWANSCPENVRPNIRQIADFHSIYQDPKTPIWKFVISSPNRQDMESAVQNLPVSEFSCEWSWIDRVDIANNGNSKGDKLIQLLAQWQISPQEVIAFGDNHNDSSMLTAVGYGVAMGNAEAEVKAQAKFVTSDNNSDGIAETLARLI
ncbi:HAD family hydrolase [Pasteurellaceae bacterium Pebbles2]|nr:HAD family hydrolase [Pasteurellaceae bacterium Pebbles2]